MIGFLYPGQGAQTVGMCKDFYEQYEIAKKIISSANEILQMDISKIMFEGPENILRDTKNTQVAVFLHSIVIDELLKSNGLIPSYLTGHSAGLYTALVCSGALSFEAGLKLIRLRGEVMSEAGIKRPGKMAAIIGLDMNVIDEICKEVSSSKGVIVIANHNSAKQIVVSGEIQAIEEVANRATKAGAKRVVVLPVSGAFHSPLMSEAQEKFSSFLDKISINDAQIPIIANTSAEVISKKQEIINEIRNHMISPVRWYNSMKKMLELGIDTFVEVGPGKILKGLLLEIDREKKVFSTFNVEEFQHTLQSLREL